MIKAAHGRKSLLGLKQKLRAHSLKCKLETEGTKGFKLPNLASRDLHQQSLPNLPNLPKRAIHWEPRVQMPTSLRDVTYSKHHSSRARDAK